VLGSHQKQGCTAVCVGLAMSPNYEKGDASTSAQPRHFHFHFPSRELSVTLSSPFNLVEVMADPFSITGSAVGVVSLGIVVCKELYTLLEDVKTATNKAEDIRAGLDRLEDHLERLETELGKFGSTSSVAGASASVVACANVLNRFRDEIPGIASANESKIRQKFQTLRFRLSYPFKKGELQYLRTLVKDIHQDLHTAQLTVLMYVSQQWIEFG
jgi:hypothetical protein